MFEIFCDLRVGSRARRHFAETVIRCAELTLFRTLRFGQRHEAGDGLIVLGNNDFISFRRLLDQA